jgi:hypothetical protein
MSGSDRHLTARASITGDDDRGEEERIARWRGDTVFAYGARGALLAPAPQPAAKLPDGAFAPTEKDPERPQTLRSVLVRDLEDSAGGHTMLRRVYSQAGRAVWLGASLAVATTACTRHSGRGCEKDTDCKGDRVCVSGACQGPVPPSASVKLASSDPEPVRSVQPDRELPAYSHGDFLPPDGDFLLRLTDGIVTYAATTTSPGWDEGYLGGERALCVEAKHGEKSHQCCIKDGQQCSVPVKTRDLVNGGSGIIVTLKTGTATCRFPASTFREGKLKYSSTGYHMRVWDETGSANVCGSEFGVRGLFYKVAFFLDRVE